MTTCETPSGIVRASRATAIDLTDVAWAFEPHVIAYSSAVRWHFMSHFISSPCVTPPPLSRRTPPWPPEKRSRCRCVRRTPAASSLRCPWSSTRSAPEIGPPNGHYDRVSTRQYRRSCAHHRRTWGCTTRNPSRSKESIDFTGTNGAAKPTTASTHTR